MKKFPLISKAVFLVFVVSACGEQATEKAPLEPNVIRPSAVQTVNLNYSQTNANILASTSSNLPIGRLGPLTLTGGTSGLFEMTSTGLSQIDSNAVTAIAKYGDSLVIGNSSGLHVYKGTLEQSPITSFLEGATVTALAVQRNQLWIGTNRGLLVFSDDTLKSFDETMNVVSLHSFENAKDVVVETMDGFEVYREESNLWTRIELGEELSLDRLVIGTNERIIGVSGGALVQRISLENAQAAWRPVATTDSETDPGAQGVETMATDPQTGAIWIVQTGNIIRLDPNEGSISQLQRPTSIGSVQSVNVSSDGSLWLYDGVQIHELGQDGDLVSYETIRAMSASSCDSCHQTLGTAPMPLDSYESWVNYVDKIIERMTNETMPPPGTKLIGGSVETVKQWKALGMPQ